jgi:cysteinyl-tRNA synthetase
VAEKRSRFLADMDDDFNTGGAIGELFDLVRILNRYCDDAGLEAADARDRAKIDSLRDGTRVLRELTRVLGLFIQPLGAPGDRSADRELANKLMQLLIQLRAAARKKKDFETADAIRNRLTELGIALEDRPTGTEWTM